MKKNSMIIKNHKSQACTTSGASLRMHIKLIYKPTLKISCGSHTHPREMYEKLVNQQYLWHEEFVT